MSLLSISTMIIQDRVKILIFYSILMANSEESELFLKDQYLQQNLRSCVP